MSDVVIRAEGLGKQYRIGERQAQYETIRDVLSNAASAVFRQSQNGNKPDETFWALKDVSFEVKRGEVLGVIGRNGAGKSTLLKVLTRITEPTEGYAEIRGRVGSLLEIGTGFHPELTGRDNIYLSGAIMGMKRAEIIRKFDDIIEFAGIERFIDTPVKRYSSGMYTRLAFAVAAHLEPEILLVDEVLAVGDAAFQRKCLGKMSEIAGEGRTVLFVSHNMAAISELCRECMVLESGAVLLIANTDEAILTYLSTDGEVAIDSSIMERQIDHDGSVDFTQALVLDSSGNATRNIHFGEPITIAISFRVNRPLNAVRIGFEIATVTGLAIASSHYPVEEPTYMNYEPGHYTLRAEVEHFLRAGRYVVRVGGHHANAARNGASIGRVMDAAIFDIIPISFESARLAQYENGLIAMFPRWQLLQKAGETLSTSRREQP
ncbi:MAG: ABC transporter ATP-binding protein [Dehalococcoidia bacterium]|nr:ABC transporter ATP-binding protein [Dehalococcoidia bacterium]